LETTPMQAEIERVLELVKSGTLTTEQGAAMIAALRETTSGDGAGRGPDTDRAAEGDEPRHRRHRRHRHRFRRHAGGADDAFERVTVDVERAIDAGARSLERVLESAFSFAGRGSDDANRRILSQAEPPAGSDYVFEGNRFTVSHLRDLRLARSTFSGNDLNAASIEGMDLTDARVTGQHLRGASIRGALIERSELADNEWNGARLSGLTLSDAGLTGSSFSGTQIRDFGVARSRIEASRVSGSKLRNLVVSNDSHAKALELRGLLGRDWLIDGSVLAQTRISGHRIDGLALKRTGFEDVEFKTTRDADLRDRGRRASMCDVVFERVVLKRCRFTDCRFDGARFEGFEASDLEFVGVDFGRARISSAAALAGFAGQAARV
jgi:uncharacterized protein YjbI with pentapeptide repeats